MISIDNLHLLTLTEGLPVTSEGKTLRYRVVHLRETNVADERIAQRQAERVVTVAGKPTLLVSDVDFRFALTCRHIEAFECDGQRIPQALIDLDMVGKLSTHDLGLIEARIFLLVMAAEVRYGNLSQADFDALVSGQQPAQVPSSPQPEGQAASAGAHAAHAESGPALLADFAGDGAARPAHADAR